MKRPAVGFRVLTLLALGSAAAPASIQSREPQVPANTVSKAKLGQLSGRVLREDTEQPLGKAIVTLIPIAQPVQGVSARTDSSGRFQFEDVVPGTYRLRAQRNGFITQIYGQRGGGPGLTIAVNAGDRVEKIEFRLVRFGVITGTLLDEDMEPVEGLSVHAIRMRFSKGGRLEASVAKTTQTDDAGDYRLSGLSPGYYFVQAGGRGNTVSINLQAPPVSYGTTYYPDAISREHASRVQVRAGTVVRAIDMRVRSAPTYTVSGIIIDPIPGGSKQYSAGFAMRGGTASTNVQRDGSFAFHGIAAGDYTIVGTSTDETGPTRRGFVNVKVVDTDVRIAVEIGKTGQLRGEARMEDGRVISMEGLRVALTPVNPEAVSVASAIDKSGSFRLQSVPVGSYSIELEGREDDMYLKQVQCGGEDYSTEPITVGIDDKAEACVLTLSQDVATIGGWVAEDGKPQDGMVVVLIPQKLEHRKNPRRTMTAQTGKDGSFRIKGIISGDYYAFAVNPMDDAAYFDLQFADRNRERAARISVKALEQANLTLKPSQPL